MKRPLKIFLMTKNENSFIENWIIYHGNIFGFENLHIIDGSDRDSIFEVYKKYKDRGLNVYHTKANLNELEKVINEQMNRHKNTDSFLIKVDTDEFLAHTNFIRKNQFVRFFTRLMLDIKSDIIEHTTLDQSLNNNRFEELLENLPITGQKYRPSNIFISEPSFEDVSDPINDINTFKPIDLTTTQGKSFFHSKSFCSTDLGGHSGVTTKNRGTIETPLIVIHYHNVSSENTIRSARQALISHKYISENDSNDVSREKLLKLDREKRECGYNSSHKVLYYLGYLNSINPETASDHCEPLLASHLAKTSGTIKNTLIKDTLMSLAPAAVPKL